MDTTRRDDLLFLLAVLEGLVCLICAYDLVRLSIFHALRGRWESPAAIFAGAAVALLLTCAVADFSHRHRPQGQPPDGPR